MRSYAIGDIHGQLALLEEAHARIAADRAACGDADAPVVHLGDLVDRGPDSAGVVDYLMKGMARGAPWVTIKGNHDRMFTYFLDDPQKHDPGLRPDYGYLHPRIGGPETLASYGVVAEKRALAEVHAETIARVPASHHAFLNALPTSYRHGEALFVHAGLRPGVPLEEQSETDLLWIRGDFHEDTRDHGALVVHGHTPVDVPSHYGNRLNLDTGAAYGGPLTVVVIEDRRVWELTKRGRLDLTPDER